MSITSILSPASIFRPAILGSAAAALLLGLSSSPASAQNKYILKANSAFAVAAAVEGDTALLTALNTCSVPMHVRLTLVDGDSGADLAPASEVDVAPGRTVHLDTVLGPVSAGLAHRVVATVDATLPEAATEVPECLRRRNAPVVVQFEIHKPGGTVLLLPAVQKVRIAP